MAGRGTSRCCGCCICLFAAHPPGAPDSAVRVNPKLEISTRVCVCLQGVGLKPPRPPCDFLLEICYLLEMDLGEEGRSTGEGGGGCAAPSALMGEAFHALPHWKGENPLFLALCT